MGSPQLASFWRFHNSPSCFLSCYELIKKQEQDKATSLERLPIGSVIQRYMQQLL